MKWPRRWYEWNNFPFDRLTVPTIIIIIKWICICDLSRTKVAILFKCSIHLFECILMEAPNTSVRNRFVIVIFAVIRPLKIAVKMIYSKKRKVISETPKSQTHTPHFEPFSYSNKDSTAIIPKCVSILIPFFKADSAAKRGLSQTIATVYFPLHSKGEYGRLE